MSEILTYVEHHPLWTLVYMMVLTWPFVVLATAMLRRSK